MDPYYPNSIRNNNIHSDNGNNVRNDPYQPTSGDTELESTVSLSVVTLSNIADEIVRCHQKISSTDIVVSNNTTTTTTATSLCRNCCVTIMKLIDNILKYPLIALTTTSQDDSSNSTMYYKVRKINLLNTKIQQSIVNYPPVSLMSNTTTTSYSNSLGVSFLLACGFVMLSDTVRNNSTSSSIGDAMMNNNTLILLSQNENQQHLMKAKQLLYHICIYELRIPINELPIMVQQQPTNVSTSSNSNNQLQLPGGFNPYQGYRIDITGQQQPTSTSVIKSNGSNSKIDIELQRLQEAQKSILEQQMKNSATTKSKNREWTMSILSSSDNTIQPTTTTTTTSLLNNDTSNTSSVSNNKDGGLLASYVQQKSMERQKRETAGFTTKAMRDIEQLKKARIYTHVTLSIQMTLQLVSSFPDNSHQTNLNINNNSKSTTSTAIPTITVQFIGKFLPNETIQVVMDALRKDCLINDEIQNSTLISNVYFELYSTPPMMTYNNDIVHHTLLQEQLVPASKLFVRWTNAATTSSLSSKTTKKMKNTASSSSTSSTKASTSPPPSISILQPQWLSLITSSSASKSTTSSVAFPKSIPITSALKDQDDNDTKPAATPTAPSPKKESKEERMLRLMMGGR